MIWYIVISCCFVAWTLLVWTLGFISGRTRADNYFYLKYEETQKAFDKYIEYQQARAKEVSNMNKPLDQLIDEERANVG